ncbi:podocalyxin like 2 [Rhinolophus ferrumequinum]|uniref:Podocalyxin like 2 n=1 Tax=Rhinolophus ferrumequinum TaxID=59479 RepID=A0A7J7TQS5_RHIFE|nr:podocalyxin-like protein 2 isoform X4 [Rhinolophus ferrumequinum]KAF6303134.1 podocalyxin like 2 [Rhinolophus ferrumequinum]
MGWLLRDVRLLPLLPPLLLLLAGSECAPTEGRAAAWTGGLEAVRGVSLGTFAAGSDEPGPEGLTSTSLLDLLLPTGLDPLGSEEPSEPMGLGAGLEAPGSGFPSEESEESRILQPPQYFWEEEEELNDSSLDLGPTADYGFPDLTEKAGPIEDTSQGQKMPSLPSSLPKMNLVEPPWPMALGEEEEEEEEKEEIEKEEEEEEEELLPVNRTQEKAQTQVYDFSLTSSSQTPRAPKHRHEDSGDQASSGVEVGSNMEPSLSPPSVTPNTVTLGGLDFASQEAGGTMLPAAGHEVEFEAPQEASEKATVGTAGLEVLSLASFPQAEAPSGAATSSEDPLYPGASTALPQYPQHMELTPSSATLGQEDLSQQPQEGQSAEAQSRIPWDSTQVICKDWSNLAGKNYIILNMTENIDCIGIQNYSMTSSCQARASQVRSDYGTLFVVLVVIGAICVVIIVLGLLYNCWQRRLPKLKHVSHGEELRFVENGCHDNPTLDVASDSQSEMQEKQPSLNGGGAVNGPGGWSALMGGKRDPEDSDVFEEDTHL